MLTVIKTYVFHVPLTTLEIYNVLTLVSFFLFSLPLQKLDYKPHGKSKDNPRGNNTQEEKEGEKTQQHA